MIQIKHLNFSYGDEKILSDINLTFNNNGLIAICGDSGCGKTTFLNCIAGLLKYNGEIEIDREILNNLSEEELGKYRLKNMGFIFQDFKLFESENIDQNILFPLDVLSSDTEERKKRKCNDLISLVGLSKHKKKSINQLSGGEKQRVAIARALVNDPKIILADEPTGSLDSKNSREIMEILCKISRNSLVFVVSHDLSLMKDYAETIVTLHDGKIIKIESFDRNEKEIFFPVCKNNSSNVKSSIKGGFLFRHTKAMIRKRKWRTIICNIVTSFGLLGVGMSFSLSRLISSNINSAYSSIVDESKIMISTRENSNAAPIYCGLPREKAIEMSNSDSNLTSGYGIYYRADFESVFLDIDKLVVTNESANITIPNISARNINEFEWLDQINETVYPHQFSELKNNEIVLGVNIQMISEICYACRIEKTLTSLSSYLESNQIPVYFDFAHYEWQYSDQQLLSLVGVVLSSTPCIYHTNHLWNEYMFEEQMRFPVNEDINSFDYYPWTFKKLYYLYSTKQYDFLDSCLNNFAYQNVIFELADVSYYPNLYRNTVSTNRNRFILYERNTNGLALSYEDYFYKVSKHISNPIFGSLGGYCIFPSYFMMGFSGETFFSFEQSSLIALEDELSNKPLEGNERYDLPSEILSGHYSKSMENSVIFQSFTGNLLKGREPNGIDEIAISSKMLYLLTGSYEVPNKPLYLSFTKSQTLFEDGSSKRDFSEFQMQVVGIVDSSRISLFHKPSWTISFFELALGISAFDLQVDAISFDIDQTKNIDQTVKDLSKGFPQFEVSYPLNSVKDGISKICLYIEIAILCLSSLAIIVSVLLLTICNYLHALESIKDIGLARCLGVSAKESGKFVYFHSIYMALSAFIYSSIELFGITLASSYILADKFGSGLTFNISGLSFLIMLFLSLGISLISSIFISRKTRNKSALECLKA